MIETNTDITNSPDIHSSSNEYKKRFQGEFGAWALDVQGKIVESILNKYTNIKNILDVGGGHGQLCPYLKDKGYNVTILSSAEDCKDQVKDYLDDKEFTFKVGNFLSLPFEDEEFDAVVCLRQVCHMTEWQEFLGELTRVAKNIVIIDYPTYRSFNILNKVLFKLKKKIEKNTRIFRIFNDIEITSEFEKNGFAVKTRAPEYFLPLVFYRMINKKIIIKMIEKFFDIFFLRKLFGSPIILEVKRK